MNNVDFSDVSKDMKEVRNTHINLGTGDDITIRDLAFLIKDIVGFSGQLEFDTTKPDGTFRRYMDIQKIHKLGWRHKIDLKEGLEREIAKYTKDLDA